MVALAVDGGGDNGEEDLVAEGGRGGDNAGTVPWDTPPATSDFVITTNNGSW